ncbi:DHA2 family efflux MFS transporter permease subunit [Nonomuraea wenchangensis]
MSKSSTAAPVTDRRLTLIGLVLALGAFTTLLDTTIVNIALDHLATRFGAPIARTQWVVTGYLLAYVAVIPVSGWISERLGARNAWLLAVGAFLAGSLLCGLAGSLPALVAFRVVQGIGGGMVIPITMSILTQAAGPDRLDKAMIPVGLPSLLGPVLGSVLGGALLQWADWRWLFLVNVPVCLAALALGARLLPATAGRRGHRFDTAGFLLLTPGVVALAYGISQAPGRGGFAATTTWVPLLAGATLIAAFTAYSLRARSRALIDVRVFARRGFGLSSLITFVSGFSTYALAFLLPLFYQQVRGESVLDTGLLLIPQGLGIMTFFLLARRLAERMDGRAVLAAGVLLTMAGIAPFALAGTHNGTVLLLAGQYLQGLGFGATTFPLMILALSGLSHDEAPRGSAAFNVVQRVGAPFGVAVIAVVLQSLLTDAAGPEDGLAAFSTTFWWTLGLSALPLLLALLVPKADTTESATSPAAAA